MKVLREHGFSLVEVLVSVAIMGGALLVSFDLVEHALRVFGESTAAAGNPLTTATEVSIRRDGQAARALPAVGTTSSGVLALQLQDGRYVEWRREGDALIRSEKKGDHATVESRPLPRRVTGWRWKVISPALLEVRIEVAESPNAAGLQQTGPPERTIHSSARVIHISPRGVRGERAW